MKVPIFLFSFFLVNTAVSLAGLTTPPAGGNKILLVAIHVKNSDPVLTQSLLKQIKDKLGEKKKSAVVAEPVVPSDDGKTSSGLSQALQKAQDQQFNFQDRKAVETVRSALGAFDKSPPELEDLSRLADAHLFLAFCHKNLGEVEAMNKALDEAARLNPNLNANELLFPPSIAGLFEKAKDRIWTEGRFSQIMIESEPGETSVFVNGAFKGKAPLRLDRYPEGAHYVTVLLGEKNAHKKIIVKEGENQTVRLKPVFHRDNKAAADKPAVLSPSDHKGQKKWLESIIPDGHEKTIGIAVFKKGGKLSILFHPAGFNDQKPETLDYSAEKSPELIANRIAKLVL